MCVYVVGDDGGRERQRDICVCVYVVGDDGGRERQRDICVCVCSRR